MKIKTLAIVVLSALSLSSAAALADTTTVNGGTVHFKGEVVNAACAVDAGSVDQTVQLGQVRTASLKQAGATSSAVGFNIQLNDCDTTVATKAAVAFLGTAIDATHTDWLCRVLLRVAQQTLVCRSWTERVLRWRWTVRHLVQKQP
ncbi:type 1 fimbriae major subunit FimA [Escherichia coli]|nr:type 1 fimbriae major subunit FimA [Escherichia coli]CTW61516.1 type 1 fimbriae major subunit FimA [Escherichia coli]